MCINCKLKADRVLYPAGVIMCNSTVRSAIVQYSKTMTYAGAPSVPMIASIRAGYQLLNSCSTQEVNPTTSILHQVVQ